MPPSRLPASGTMLTRSQPPPARTGGNALNEDGRRASRTARQPVPDRSAGPSARPTCQKPKRPRQSSSHPPKLSQGGSCQPVPWLKRRFRGSDQPAREQSAVPVGPPATGGKKWVPDRSAARKRRGEANPADQLIRGQARGKGRFIETTAFQDAYHRRESMQDVYSRLSHHGVVGCRKTVSRL